MSTQSHIACHKTNRNDLKIFEDIISQPHVKLESPSSQKIVDMDFAANDFLWNVKNTLLLQKWMNTTQIRH